MQTYTIDSVTYELHPDGALAQALSRKAAAEAQRAELVAEQRVIGEFSALQVQINQLEAEAERDTGPLDAAAQREATLAAAKRRLERARPIYDAACQRLNAAGQAARDADVEIAGTVEAVRTYARQARQIEAQLADETKRLRAALSVAQRDLRMRLGDLKPGDVRRDDWRSPWPPSAFWPEGPGYVAPAKVTVQLPGKPAGTDGSQPVAPGQLVEI